MIRAVIVSFLLIVFAVLCRAQDQAVQSNDLGSIGELIANTAKSARGGTSVDFNKHVDGVFYVPYPAIHSADGKVEYADLGFGIALGSGVEGTKLKGAPLIVPMVNVIGLTGRIFNSNWSKSHLSFPALGNIDIGLGIKPLPVPGSHDKWIIGNQIIGVLTYGFSKK